MQKGNAQEDVGHAIHHGAAVWQSDQGRRWLRAEPQYYLLLTARNAQCCAVLSGATGYGLSASVDAIVDRRLRLADDFRTCQRAAGLDDDWIVVAVGDQALCLRLLQFCSHFSASLGRHELGFWWKWRLSHGGAGSGKKDDSGSDLLGVHGNSP